MPQCIMVDYILIISACLIIHYPSAINYFNLAILNKSLCFHLNLRVLNIIPFFKIFHFDKSKSFIFIKSKLTNHCVINILDIDPLSVLVWSIKVFLWSFQPAYIHMWMRNYMNIKWIIVVWISNFMGRGWLIFLFLGP